MFRGVFQRCVETTLESSYNWGEIIPLIAVKEPQLPIYKISSQKQDKTGGEKLYSYPIGSMYGIFTIVTHLS